MIKVATLSPGFHAQDAPTNQNLVANTLATEGEDEK